MAVAGRVRRRRNAAAVGDRDTANPAPPTSRSSRPRVGGEWGAPRAPRKEHGARFLGMDSNTSEYFKQRVFHEHERFKLPTGSGAHSDQIRSLEFVG